MLHWCSGNNELISLFMPTTLLLSLTARWVWNDRMVNRWDRDVLLLSMTNRRSRWSSLGVENLATFQYAFALIAMWWTANLVRFLLFNQTGRRRMLPPISPLADGSPVSPISDYYPAWGARHRGNLHGMEGAIWSGAGARKSQVRAAGRRSPWGCLTERSRPCQVCGIFFEVCSPHHPLLRKARAPFPGWCRRPPWWRPRRRGSRGGSGSRVGGRRR